MNWSFLSFIGEPWFVVPWYVVGAAGAFFVAYDVSAQNTALKPAMKWAWPIIVFFFSVLGLALYFGTARAPEIGKKRGEQAKLEAHHEYERSMWRRVTGAVIHCVAGDGLGIMTAMVIARATGMSFWQEFWFEYVVGFLAGWLIFQRKSMSMMTERVPKQLAMAFRAEFFSMLTVMGGMGAVMTYVTPMVATNQPKPLTFAFWGFGMLGLLLGFVFTYPTNWLMVKLGWKHGMGGMEAGKEHEVHGSSARAGLITATVALGCAALFLPAWLTKAREEAGREGAPGLVGVPTGRDPLAALSAGLRGSIERGVDGLTRGNRTEAALAMDGALRSAEAGEHSAPGEFGAALAQIRTARRALQRGDDRKALTALRAITPPARPAASARAPNVDVRRYRGAKVIDAGGAVIGEVTGTSPDSIEVALGGWRDAWGFVDFSARRRLWVPTESIAFGPVRALGLDLVLLPTEAARAHARR